MMKIFTFLNIQPFIFWISLAIFTIVLFVFFFIGFILSVAFSRRFDFHPHLKYFKIEDFPTLDMDRV